MSFLEYLAVALVAGGVFFTLVAVIGVIRLPDIYARAHATSKSDTLGSILALAGVALVLQSGVTTTKTVFLLLFMLITNPTAAHAITRAAYDQDITPWTAEEDQ